MLKSQLFQGNDRLKKCEVNNASHIKLNDKGDFVSKIQEALAILDNALFFGDEVNTQTYGKSTAQAVLDFKSGPRQIINKSYQKTADDIVGIMTIQQMDKEMLAMEALMPAMIQRARLAGFQRTFAAAMRTSGIGPPAPTDKRIDPNFQNRLRALELARTIFNEQNPDMDDIGSTLGDMKNRLASPTTPIERAHFPDQRCGSRDAFVAGNRVPIMLCPKFFGTTEEQRIRTMVHESAHLTGIGDPDGESYYFKYNRLNEEPGIVQGSPKSTKRSDMADTWAKFVNAVTDQPPDK